MTEEKKMECEPGLILLTGATGYVGGRLLPALEQKGYRVRCLARHPEFLKAKVGGVTDKTWRSGHSFRECSHKKGRSE